MDRTFLRYNKGTDVVHQRFGGVDEIGPAFSSKPSAALYVHVAACQAFSILCSVRIDARGRVFLTEIVTEDACGSSGQQANPQGPGYHSDKNKPMSISKAMPRSHSKAEKIR